MGLFALGELLLEAAVSDINNDNEMQRQQVQHNNQLQLAQIEANHAAAQRKHETAQLIIGGVFSVLTALAASTAIQSNASSSDNPSS